MSGTGSCETLTGAAYFERINSREVSRSVRGAFQDLVRRTVPLGALLFDFGAGPGIDARFLAERGYTVSAYDADPRMCKFFATHRREFIDSGRIILERGGYREFLNRKTVFGGRPANVVISNFAPLNQVMSTSGQVLVRAEGPATSAPFFIVGSGRSGTTLLRMMITAHSRLTVPPETWFLLPLVRRFRIDRPLGAGEIECAISMITGAWSWPDMKLDAQDFRRRVSRLTEPFLRDLVEVVYRWHMEAEGKVRWGDKTPGYVEILPTLASMYPNSRFIHLIRDGRDVAKSTQATGWFGRWLHDSTRAWTKALEHQRRWARSDFRDRILEVRYEDLMLETEAALRDICRFLGEEFEPRMLSWEGQVDEQVPARERIYHTRLKLKVGSENVSRWKREMTAREAFVSEAFMGSHLARLGYERRYPSRLWAPAFALTRVYCHTVLPAVQFQIRVVRSLRRRLGLRLGPR